MGCVKEGNHKGLPLRLFQEGREIWQKAKFKSQAGQGLLFSFLVNFAFLTFFLNPVLAGLRQGLKNSKINKIRHFANHPYLSAREATHCKGLILYF
ncbi:hypothetical protein MNB_SUP05-SYMBIONT-7-512 [hydrothermal vent metagenome]|uniref:Uncharacterized protein n=1 Tax=hydrothermal vent metagenome TaxID=652676 RepID=A0A1W1E212_9ZZZZ